MFAAPVKAKNVEYSHVDNNGHAMAPLYDVRWIIRSMYGIYINVSFDGEKQKKSRVDFSGG